VRENGGRSLLFFPLLLKFVVLAFYHKWIHNKILANPDSPDVPRLEAEINKQVYELYDLTPEEIAIVEGRE